MRRLRSALAAVAFVTGGVVIGGAIEGSDDPRPPRAPVAAATPERDDTATTGPNAVVAGVPVGYARSPDGALAAARAYGGMGELLLRATDDELRAAIEAMASRHAAASLLADARDHREALARELGDVAGSVRWREAPLAARVEEFGAERARVALWRVGVLWAPDAAPPQAQWSTSRYELVWERGDWKLASQTSEPGPTPINGADAAPMSAEEFDAALEDFSVPAGW